MAINKKLIGFDDALLERIEEYTKDVNQSFTGAVRQLIEVGLAHDHESQQDQTEPDGIDLITRVKKLEEDISWWNADDTQSKLNNLEGQIRETIEHALTEMESIDKKLNVLTKVSQLFKGHLKNREIHLQD